MGNQIADIKLMQMFPWFGALKSAKDEMSLMANAKYEFFRDAKLQVFYDVQNTWYEIYKINQEIRISEKNLQILKTIERLALVRFRTSGVSSGSTSSGSMGSGNTFQSQPARQFFRNAGNAGRTSCRTSFRLRIPLPCRGIIWDLLPAVQAYLICTAYK